MMVPIHLRQDVGSGYVFVFWYSGVQDRPVGSMREQVISQWR